ncbi:MAG: hypothetical protein WAT23_03400 [Chromatiaceae bacterium]
MKTKLVWLSLGALTLGLITYSLLRVWPVLFPQLVATAPLVSSCDLRQGPCMGSLPAGGKVRFDIEPRSIPVLHPLNLTVRTEGLDVHAVEVDFAGTDMNMGYNRVQLEAVGPGDWQGQVTLPTCVRSRMKWEAKVLLATDLGLMAVPFRFDSFNSAPGG